MRSKTSFFNPGLFRKNMLRFWPVWAAYAGIWLLGFAGVWRSLTRYSRLSSLADTIVGSGWLMGILLGCSFGLVAAMCVCSYLHNPRAAYFYHALPVDRPQLFGTALISGLAMAMVPNLVFWLLGTVWCSVFTMATLWESILMLTMWLLELTTQYIFYFGAAMFCAMLTGHLLVMPCLYAAMNFCVPVAEWLVRGLCTMLIWGFEYGTVQLHWLSPLYHELANGRMPNLVQDGVLGFAVDGYHLLIGAVGILLIALSWLLYKRRQLEAAGDVIAVSWLRPVFKYGLGLYGALPLGIMFFAILLQGADDYINTAGPFLLLCFCLLLGGLICYLAAAMLLEKSFKVLKKHGPGFLAVALALVMLLVGLRLDVLGLETWTPDLEDVSGIRVWGAGHSINSSDPEVMRRVIQAHKQIVNSKPILEDAVHAYQYENYQMVILNGTPTLVRRGALDKGYIGYPEKGIVTKGEYIAGIEVMPQAVAEGTDGQTYYVSLMQAENTTVQIRYTMKNGYTAQRSYLVPITVENKNDALRTALAGLGDLTLKAWLGLDREYESVDSMSLNLYEGGDLLPEKAVETNVDRQRVMDALRLDYLAGNLDGTQEPIIRDRAYYENSTGWRLEYHLTRTAFKSDASNSESYETYDYHSLVIPQSAVCTLGVLQDMGVLVPSEYLVVAE